MKVQDQILIAYGLVSVSFGVMAQGMAVMSYVSALAGIIWLFLLIVDLDAYAFSYEKLLLCLPFFALFAYLAKQEYAVCLHMGILLLMQLVFLLEAFMLIETLSHQQKQQLFGKWIGYILCVLIGGLILLTVIPLECLRFVSHEMLDVADVVPFYSILFLILSAPAVLYMAVAIGKERVAAVFDSGLR